MDVEPDLVGAHHLKAGCDGEVVEQMKRLLLGPEAEDEMDDAGDQRRPAIVVLAPIPPAPTGNGLAMRVQSMISAAGRHHNVHLFMLPLAGRVPHAPSVPPGVVAVHELAEVTTEARSVMIDWISDPWWRDRLAALVPLPDPSSFAPPTRATEVTALLGDTPVQAVLALRLSTALLGTSLARQLGIPLIVDADDDDVDLLLRQGRTSEAAAWERVGQLCLGSATLTTVAGAPDDGGIRRRYGLSAPVTIVPNSVVIPPQAMCASRPGRGRILFLANLRYRPNVEAARWFVGQVLPLLDPRWSIDLVGSCGPEVGVLAGPRVTVRGQIANVADAYARADVAVAPLLVGSGTRIKVIEAMAYRCPVVATTAGCAGIAAVPGRDLLRADRPDDFAQQVAALDDAALSDRLVAAAAVLVARLYDATSIIESAGRLFRTVTTTGTRTSDGTEAGRSKPPT
jgi:glycosyltransferase involved in cell wall biosynthesis